MIYVDRYTDQLIIVRNDGIKNKPSATQVAHNMQEAEDLWTDNKWKEEMVIKKAGMWKWNESEKAYTYPKARIIDLVAMAKGDGIVIEYPEDLLEFEKESKKKFDATLAYLRLIRQVGILPGDIDYFSTGQYKGTYTPYGHQLVGFQWGSMMDSCALLMEMGTGKTPVAIWIADESMNKKEVFACLVVAPKNVVWNWEREIKANAPHRKVVILDGSARNRLELLDTVADFYLINYEGIRVLGEELKDRFQMVILDEAHKMKDPSTQQTKAIQKYLSSAKRKIIMTGTPIGNSLLDLHQPFVFLDKNMFENFYTWRERFFFQERFKWKPFPGTQEMIQDRIFTRSVRYLKTECLDLPSKVYITRKTRLYSEQAEIYKKLGEAFITAFQEGRIKAVNVLSQIMKFSQITSGFVKMHKATPVMDENGIPKEELVEYEFPKCAKIDLLEEVLDEIGTEEKVVIWARFVHDIKRIKKMLGDRAIAFFGESKETPQYIVDTFNNRSDIQYLVGNPQVGGVGLNLTSAKYMIYFSNDYSFIKRSQSEDRCHRIGSEKHDKITIIDLVCDQTIDVPVVRTLRDKKELSSVVIDAFSAGVLDAFIDTSDGTDGDKMKKLEEIFGKGATVTELVQEKCEKCGSFNIESQIDEFRTQVTCLDCKAVNVKVKQPVA